MGSFTIRLPRSCNGRYLGEMGLTRERWCCAAGCWLSKFDIDACQTSIKYRCIDAVFWDSPSWVPNILEITTVGPQRTDLSGEGHADKQ